MAPKRRAFPKAPKKGKKKAAPAKSSRMKKTARNPVAKAKAAQPSRRNTPSSGIKRLDLCPACGSDNILANKERGEIVCRDCQEIFAELNPDDERRYERASGII